MIRFTDRRLFLKGTSEAILTDKSTGNIVYFSDKFQTSNIAASVTMGEIRAGIGNAIAAMIPTDSGVTVNFAAADFNLFAKAAQAGSTLQYGAPVMVCHTVTATGTSLTVPVSEGTPVAQLGMSAVQCYVQEINAKSPISTGGIAYALNASTGAVSGFVAENGKQYKVWYFVSKSGAQLATISTNIDPQILHFSAAMAVYSNEGGSANGGTRVGTLYVIVPSLKLGGDGAGVNGDQTTPDTTSITGQAIASSSDVIEANCNECGAASNVLAYYLYVPCDGASDIQGLALVGGVLTVPKSSTKNITEFKLVMADGSLANVDPAFMSYELTSAPSGTSVSGSVITTGATTGECDISATYTDGEDTFTCDGVLAVV